MSEQFSGIVDISDDQGNPTISLDGNERQIVIRDSDNEDVLSFRLDDGFSLVEVGATNGGSLGIRDSSDSLVLLFSSTNASLILGTDCNGGDLQVVDENGHPAFHLQSFSGRLVIGNQEPEGKDGKLNIFDGDGQLVCDIDGNTGTLELGTTGKSGQISIHDAHDRQVFFFNSQNAALHLGASGNEGDLVIVDANDRQVFKFNSQSASLRLGATGNEGDLVVRDNAGNDTIHLDGATGNISFSNSDAAEQFEVANRVTAEPGTVMVLDRNGKLRPCSDFYDTKVVGIVAGAGSYRPGIILGKQDGQINHVPISVLGKVCCKADATYSSIEVGDLLTTSQTVGHAMKATDTEKAFGSIIGKALTSLHGVVGSIVMVVSLQ